MDLNEVAVFIKVIQEGSFSQAAKKLGMPNSTVSHKVSSLEKRLGATLIQRTTRKLLVTPAGQAYFKRCMQGLEEIEAAESELLISKGEPQGLLRITGPVELGSTILPEIISQYTTKYPKVRTEVILTERYVDLLSEGVDLAIRAGELKDSSLIAKKIGSVCFVLVASPKYLKVRGSPSHPRELRQHRCLQHTPMGIEEWKLTSTKGAFNVPLPGQIISNDLKMIKLMALRGDGIALLPNHICYSEVANGKLVRILPEWHTNNNPIHFVYPSQRFVTPKLSFFMDMAMGSLKKLFENFDF
ncbi:LysR substrate-binding domain-containing protein [Bdellovibrio sp. HCB337]|uniref:LysR family transcriptional regulator n=1 Tax=Bdellovibrio sp. HCB337 TaxID=3394358 RepID=UPI0039A59228